MRLTEMQIKDLIAHVFNEWKTQGIVTFKVPEAKAAEKIAEVLRGENQKIFDFENEIKKMLDGLESSAPQGFDRHKMYLLLKQRLAKEKGIIL